MHVLVTHERGEVGQTLMTGVQQPQFHLLVGSDIAGHLNAGLLPLRSTGRKVIFDDPLEEGLAQHRPFVRDPQLVRHRHNVLGGSAGGDPVDHRIGKRDFAAHPSTELSVSRRRERRECVTRHITVVLNVVA